MRSSTAPRPRTTRALAAGGVLLGVLVSATACGGDDETTGAASTMGSSMPTSSMPMTSAAAMDGPVGPGCADYAKAVPSGAGSVDGMAQDPVAVAASNNPLLKTLVAAVSGKLNPKVNLVDTLNGGQFTVFAPVDAAFGKVDPKTIETLKTDDALLTKILTYHVVAGRLSPSQVVGSHDTVEGEAVTVSGTPDMLTVNGANVICGGVSTANATVYLIDGVLTPKG
ncbi:MAG: fasciclin domain-containing protein [Kineosporiaceae bacterium]